EATIDIIAQRKLKILERLDFIGFWTGNSKMLMYNHFRAMNISRHLGPTVETLRVLCVHMAILITLPLPTVFFKGTKKKIYFYLKTAGEIHGILPGVIPAKLLYKAVEAGIILFQDGDINNSLDIINHVMNSFWLERTSAFIQEITSIYSQILEAANKFDQLIILGEKTEELATMFENPIFWTYAKTYKAMGLLFKGKVNQARLLLEEACEDFLKKKDVVVYVIAGKYLVKAYYLDGEYNLGRRLYKDILAFMKKNSMSHPAYFGIHGFFIEAESMRNLEKGFYDRAINKEINKALKELKLMGEMFPFLKSIFINATLIYSLSTRNKKEVNRIFQEGEQYYRLRKEPYYKGLFYYYYSYFFSGDEQQTYLHKSYLLLHHCGSAREMSIIEQLLEKSDPSLIEESKDSVISPDFSQDMKTTRELDLIIDIGKKIISIHDLDKLLSEILEQSLEIVGAEQGELFLQEENNLKSINPNNLNQGKSIPTCQGLIKMVIEKKIPIIVSNAAQDPVFRHDRQVINHQLKSMVCVPLISNDHFLGLIYLSNHQIGNLFSDHELELLVSLAGEAAVAIENALLLKQTKELQLQMSNIINSIPSGIIAVDKNGKIIQYNQIIHDFLENGDSSNRQYEGIFFGEAFPQLEICRPIFDKIISSIKDFEEIEIKIDKRIFMVGISPLVGDVLYGAVIKLNEITEARKNQEHMIQVQKMETVSTMVGGLAHDFNNTLTGIYASTYYLSNSLDENKDIDVDEIKDSMETIGKAVERASGLVNQLLTFSMKKEAQMIPVNLLEIIEHAIKVSRKSFDKRIDFNIQLPEKETVIMADSAQLEQVILNLMINASHAMTIMRNRKEDWGGKLSIELRSTYIKKEEMLRILQLENGSYWCLSISDTGVGMDVETKEKIFEPFFTTKRSGEGTGLGLAMVYSIVRRLNGYLEVYSEIDKGTIFNLYFPMQEITAKEIEIEIEKIAPRNIELKGNSTLLIAEDESILRVAIAKSLEASGFTVIQTENGKEAFEYYKENYKDIDFVLLDMVMPEMTGQEAYYAMKEINNDIVVILTSGFRKDNRVEELMQNGVQYFLQKPYGKNELFKYIQAVTENQ
ncbi:MAG: response regulator, partial [Spirochaetaceae bacterium]|nr:response regulator [Spirochaetaceae bacterium]